MGAAPIGPVDHVRSLDTASDGVDSIVTGHSYQIDRLQGQASGYFCGYCGERCIGVVLTTDKAPDGVWCATAFELIYKPKASLIQGLLSDIPTDALASPEEVVA